MHGDCVKSSNSELESSSVYPIEMGLIKERNKNLTKLNLTHILKNITRLSQVELNMIRNLFIVFKLCLKVIQDFLK